MARRDRPRRFRLAGHSDDYFEVRQIVLPATELRRLIPAAVPEQNCVGELTANDAARASRKWAGGRPALEVGTGQFRWIEIEPEDADDSFELLCVVLLPTDLGTVLGLEGWTLVVAESAVGKVGFYVVFARRLRRPRGGMR